MKKLDIEETNRLLNRIMEFELAGVVRYTHYSLMVTGPNRLPIVQFMKAQASESLLHAQQAGEILTGLGGHPSQRIAEIEESFQHDLRHILRESLAHESRALDLYKELLDVVEDRSVYIEEYTRTMIGQEELHGLELRKMLRDYGAQPPPFGREHEGMTGAKSAKKEKKEKAKDAREKDTNDGERPNRGKKEKKERA